MIRQLGNWTYRSEDRLGGGGYAQAYRGLPAGAPEPVVAVKVFDDPHYANTFEREVAALKLMAGCPGTLELVDHGRNAAGALCIVTTLVPGVRLDRLVRERGPLSGDQARALVGQLLAVLEFAHGRGLLHKDIKASNILADGGRYTLLDWGVAEPIGDGRAESIRAKLDHVAPECFHGRHGRATDFYSLGWLVVHATTGMGPYHFDENRERDYRVAAHCLEDPMLPAALPAEWRALVSNWIGKDPARRLQGYTLEALMAEAKTLPSGGEAAMLDYRERGDGPGFLRLAAEAGIPYAQHELALGMLKDGWRDEALFWLEQAAAAGYARAACRLAVALIERGSVLDVRRARDLLQQAGQAGNGEACYRLGMLLLGEGEAEAATGWLKRAADGGHRNAQYRYARLIGAGNAEERREALTYFEAAAERGHASARQRIEELSSTETVRMEGGMA